MSLGALFSDAATEMLVPVLPIFLTQSLGATGAVVGLVDGVAQAIRNFVEGFSGAISDRMRQRKPFVLIGYALSAIAKPLMGVSTIWESVLGARLLDRLGAGVRAAPRDAMVASSVDDREEARGFGIEALGEYVGAFAGPLLTVFLLFALQTDIRTVFYVAFVPSLIGLIVVAFVRERSSVINAVRPRFTLKGFSNSYWYFLAVTAVFSAGNSSNSFIILRAQEMEASLVYISLLYAGFNLVAALAAYPSGILADTAGRKVTLLDSYVVFFIVYIGLFVSKSLIVVVVVFLLYGLYQSTFRSVGKALACDYAPEQLRASAIGWFSATAGLMQLVASLIAGALWDKVNHESVFLFGAASSFIGIVALMLMIYWQRVSAARSR
jgi:MFS family permease